MRARTWTLDKGKQLAQSAGPGRRLLDGWMAIVAHFGEVQTLVLLGLVYTFAIGPTAILMGLARRDFLGKRGFGAPGTAWRVPDSRPSELENVKQPF